jgi:hypothetical protein
VKAQQVLYLHVLLSKQDRDNILMIILNKFSLWYRSRERRIGQWVEHFLMDRKIKKNTNNSS